MKLGFANPFRNAQSAVAPLAPAEAAKLAKSGDITLLDVRDHAEIAQSGKAKGAIHIPLFQINQQGDPRHPEFHKGLDQNKPVAVYCASGARSNMAAQALKKFGFSTVYNMGGFFQWQAAGGPCER